MFDDLDDLRVITRSSMKIICLILFDYENTIIIYYNCTENMINYSELHVWVKLAQGEP